MAKTCDGGSSSIFPVAVSTAVFVFSADLAVLLSHVQLQLNPSPSSGCGAKPRRSRPGSARRRSWRGCLPHWGEVPATGGAGSCCNVCLWFILL